MHVTLKAGINNNFLTFVLLCNKVHSQTVLIPQRKEVKQEDCQATFNDNFTYNNKMMLSLSLMRTMSLLTRLTF